MQKPKSATTRQKEVFLAARDLATAEERARCLAESCGDDAALRTRVEQMLAADAEAHGFMEAPVEPQPELPLPVAGDKIGYFGDYVLLDEIARGASGVVFRARQVSLDRVVALKMLRDRPLLTSEADTQRLRAEAASAAALDHPHIVPIYEVGGHEGQPYFTMKLIEGGTLQYRMAEFQADARKAVALMAQVARAVHHAHMQGILHRDLKPGNVLVDHAGEPHITDFGLARKIGEASLLTVTGQIVGTPHYMAPEQVRGAGRELTPGADIYSLGAMLYELLERRRVFDGDDIIKLLKQVAESPPPPLRRAPADLAAAVIKCLAKNPANRYGTAGALAEDLERWLRGARMQVRPASGMWRLAWRAAAVLALPAGGVLLWKNMPKPATRTGSPVSLTVTTLADELDTPGVSGTGVSLREAIRGLEHGGRITFDPAVFSMGKQITLSESLGGMDITRAVTLDAGGVRGGVTIHSSQESSRIFTIMPGAAAVLHNLTLKGEADAAFRRGNVGAIDNGGSLTMTDCRLLDNGGGGNGGAINTSGNLTLQRCVFRGNTTQAVGGALCIRGRTARVQVEHCEFTGNRAYGQGGGAIVVTHALQAVVLFTHCTITGNSCEASPGRTRDWDFEMVGGGLRIRGGRVVLSHCIVAGNASPVAGKENIAGMFMESGPNFLAGDPKDAPAGLGAVLR